jgi:hypothetical protein
MAAREREREREEMAVGENQREDIKELYTVNGTPHG